MKQIAFTFLLSISILSVADTTNIGEKFFVEKIKAIEALHKSYTDSLNKELTFYRLKEDYFTVAIEDQSNRFALIVASILGLVTLVSFAGFRNELNKLKSEYETQVNFVKNELIIYKKKTKIYDYNLQISFGNIFALGADGLSGKGEAIIALEFYLASARAHSLSGQILVEENETIEGENPFLYAIANMQSAMLELREIIRIHSNKQFIKDKSVKFLDELTIISQIKNSDLQDLCAECRITIKNFIKD
jgi:hypothetical protein